MSSINFENLYMNLFPIGISMEMGKNALEELKLDECRENLRNQKAQGNLPPGFLLMGKNCKQRTQLRRTCEYLFEIFFARGFRNFPALVQPKFEEKWSLYRAKLRESKEIKDWLPDEQKRDHPEEKKRKKLAPVKFVKEGLGCSKVICFTGPRLSDEPCFSFEMIPDGEFGEEFKRECEGQYWDTYWRWSGYWEWKNGCPQQALPLQKIESLVCSKLQDLYIDKESLGSEALLRKLKRKATFDANIEEADQYWDSFPKGPPPKRVIVENINLEESGRQRTAERRGYHEFFYAYPPKYMEPPPPTGPFRVLNILPPDYLKPEMNEEQPKRINSYYIYEHEKKSYYWLEVPPTSRRITGQGPEDHFEDILDFYTRIGLSEDRKSELCVQREFKRLGIRKILEDKKLKEMGFVPKPKPPPRVKCDPRKPRLVPFSD